MATRTLAEAFQYASQYMRLMPFSFTSVPSGGRTGDPALSMGDWVRQTILSPPFAWRWNRVIASAINTVVSTQDYTASLANFGWLERASVANSGITKELQVKLTLAEDSVVNLPGFIAPLIESGANQTFRLLPNPDKVYSLKLTYQAAAPSFSAVSDTWAPIPDYMFHVVSQGIFAKAYEYVGDERWPLALQAFFKQLIAFHGGLSESQISLFMGHQQTLTVDAQSLAMRSQQEIMARGLQ